MPSPYSEDLRKRVMEKVLEGKTKLKEIAKMFKVSEKTIYLWRTEYKNNNNLKPKEGYQKGHSHIFTDLEEFKKV
jgi:transposase